MDSMMRGRNSEGKSRFVRVDDEGNMYTRPADDGKSGDGGLINAIQGETSTTHEVEGKRCAVQNMGTIDLEIEINDISIIIEPDTILSPQILRFEGFTEISIVNDVKYQLFIYG